MRKWRARGVSRKWINMMAYNDFFFYFSWFVWCVYFFFVYIDSVNFICSLAYTVCLLVLQFFVFFSKFLLLKRNNREKNKRKIGVKTYVVHSFPNWKIKANLILKHLLCTHTPIDRDNFIQKSAIGTQVNNLHSVLCLKLFEINEMILST